MYNVGLHRFRVFKDRYGNLIPVEAGMDIPFPVRRIYYIYGVQDGVRRGFHSHKALHQVLICVSGSVSILVKTPEGEETFTLSDPSEGLYIGPLIWREMFDFSADAVLLVLASEHYCEADYIRNYDEYLKAAGDLFKSREENENL